MAICFTDEELQAFHLIDHACVALYVKGIRPFMDYASGVVGVKRKISWQSLRECIYVPSRPGVKEKYPSKASVRRIAYQLEKAGLISVKSQEKLLIFNCILAKRDSQVQKKAGTPHPPKADTQADRFFVKQVIDFPEKITPIRFKADREADTPETLKAGIPPVEDNIINNNKYILSKTASDFEIFWQAYPKRAKRKETLRIFKNNKLHLHLDDILSDIAWRLKHEKNWREKNQFIPLPSSYLSGERWLDEKTEFKNDASKRTVRFSSLKAVIEDSADFSTFEEDRENKHLPALG